MSKMRITKSTLSMFLRTKCDRALYLSLHRDSDLKNSGMPVPLSARPGIGDLKTIGIEFEKERNNKLIEIFNSLVVYEKDKDDKLKRHSLEKLINRVKCTPSLILQGQFNPQKIQKDLLKNIGIKDAIVSQIPSISKMVPDIIIIRNPIEGDEEICSDGRRDFLNYKKESRQALSIIDIKHTSSANPSYRAEIALYALLLANWIKKIGLDKKYFVSSKSYLWTLKKRENSNLESLISKNSNAECHEKLNAMISDCEDASLRFYLPTVLNFFREDIPRVIKIALTQGWESLDWHVDSRCSACDWLGHDGWASKSDKKTIASNPSHYCFTSARNSFHLSQISGLTRGARKTLENNQINNTKDAATVQPSHEVFGKHNHLKKEKGRIAHRAKALINSIASIDSTALIPTLNSWPNLYINIIVNFDPSSGLLTGLAISGHTTTYTKGQKPLNFPAEAFPVDQKELADEWIALSALLSTLSDMIDRSEEYIKSQNKTNLSAQVAFWDKRQFIEICNAIGRHLPKVLNLENRKERALAWLFPPDELMPRADAARSPCIFFVDEIVRKVVFAPIPHVITLFDTAEAYSNGYTPKPPNPFYREFLTDGVPRERVYEIWSNATTVKRGSLTIPRNKIIRDVSDALERQCKALNSIVERIRHDFRGKLKANTPRLNLSISTGTRKVAYDSKLWIRWEELQYHSKRLEEYQRLTSDAETLEANYEALRITDGRRLGNSNEYAFRVMPNSVDAKIEKQANYLALGKSRRLGFPLEKSKEHLPNTFDDWILNSYLCHVLQFYVVDLDRAKETVTIRPNTDNGDKIFSILVSQPTLDILDDVFLVEGITKYRWYEKVTDILKDIGNPHIAFPDPNAVEAMGISPLEVGSDEVTPVAKILWDPCTVQKKTTVTKDEARSVAKLAEHASNLNESQIRAVEHSVEKQLTIIWGPPGTGKTKTLVASIHCLVRHAIATGAPLTILITAQTYRALEEVVDGVVEHLGSDPSCPASIYTCHSRDRNFKEFYTELDHLNVTPVCLGREDKEMPDFLTELQNPKSITIVAATTMQAFKFSYWLSERYVSEVFDVVIIDESSQVQVTSAISPLSTLKKNSRVIIAGDHLQMPPIMQVEPPSGAEYLVGSIQRYLLERFNQQIDVCELEENYRSAEDIVAYARQIGYSSRLISSNPDTSLHLLKDPSEVSAELPDNLPLSSLWSDIVDPEKKVLSLLHEDDLSSQSNIFEASIVTTLVWYLKNCVSACLDGRASTSHVFPDQKKFWQECVGVVTPHRAQRAAVVRRLKEVFPQDCPDYIDSAVDTVEKFQGSERHTIIITFGVGDTDIIEGEEAFLMQLERINVATSRAMAKCLVIMPKTLAGHVPKDKKALDTAYAIKDYVEEFCNVEKVDTIEWNNSIVNAKLRYHK